MQIYLDGKRLLKANNSNRFSDILVPSIKWTYCARRMLANDMRIDLRGSQVIVSQQLLNRSYVSPREKQLCRKGMPKRVCGNMLSYSSFLNRCS